MKRAGLISRRWSRCLVATSLTGATALAFWPAPRAGADAPDQKGYWMESQQAGAPSQPPPNVPAGGLFVAYSPSAGATAISALRFNIGDERSGTLLLRIHQDSSGVTAPSPPQEVRDILATTTTSTTTPPPQKETVHIAVCDITSDWKATAPTGVGAWADRPAYKTTGCVPGHVSDDGYSVDFPIGSFHQRSPGVYDLAVVPDPATIPLTSVETPDPTGSSPSVTAPSDTPFEIAFDEPLAEALTLEDLPEQVDDDVAPVEDATPPPTLPSAFPVDNGFFPAVDVPTTLPVPTPARPRVPLTPRTAVPASSGGLPKEHRAIAIALLGALAVAWWWIGGAEARRPQRVSAAPAGSDAPEPVAGEQVGGIGRFAKPRSGRPRKLL